MKQILFVAIIAFLAIQSFGQTGQISGQVLDEKGLILPGATLVVVENQLASTTNNQGDFVLGPLKYGVYHIHTSFLGYSCQDVEIRVNQKQNQIVITMKPAVEQLDEVTITDHTHDHRKNQDPLNVEQVNQEYLNRNRGGSLMQSLERLPGVSTIEIGSGQSKPVIRGLSFNRVVVVENGLKHEGQQWGLEHGLEIDQYAVENVEVIKGPASLLYGSDAIGGIIDIKPLRFPQPKTLKASVETHYKSNNHSLGYSIHLEGRREKWFFNARISQIRFSDFRVPTDSVSVYSFKVPLKDQRLRNTAGNENGQHLDLGYISSNFNSTFYLSRYNSQSGFFANAHGLEPRQVDTELHDKSISDIQEPYHNATHYKITNVSHIYAGLHHLSLEAGYQKNIRTEWSDYVTHGYMPSEFPTHLSFPRNLEVGFNKDVWSAQLKDEVKTGNHQFTVGLSSGWQHNTIDGRGFIIPAFEQLNLGVFVYDKIKIGTQWWLHAGLRYDYGQISTHEYHDWFESPVITETDTIYTYLQRSSDLTRVFSELTWAIGVNYNTGHFSFKANAGKSFRMPIAKELASNGVNYHFFSYEIGDNDLDAETSYQVDLTTEWNFPVWAVQISPFASYFPNYIYLNPTSDYDFLYGAGNQVFRYTQSEVMRYGGEIHAHYKILDHLKAGFIGEYIYSIQTTGPKKGFGLPFAPPANVLFNLAWQTKGGKYFTEPFFSADYQYTFPQNQIVPPEKKSAGYHLFHISMGTKVKLKNQMLELNVQVKNLFNTKYYNHTSYYKLIDLPEPGRSFIVSLKIPITIVGND